MYTERSDTFISAAASAAAVGFRVARGLLLVVMMWSFQDHSARLQVMVFSLSLSISLLSITSIPTFLTFLA
jgi:hypothetical protein